MERVCDDRVTAQRIQEFMCYVMIDIATDAVLRKSPAPLAHLTLRDIVRTANITTHLRMIKYYSVKVL